MTTVRCATPAEPGTAMVHRQVGKITLDDGDDTIAVPSDPVAPVQAEIDGGAGNDTITGPLRAFGGPADDRLDAYIAEGGDGNDHITATTGAGGEGDDVLVPPAGRNQAVRFKGGGGADVLTGGDDVDSYRGNGDSLDGGDGDDKLTGHGGDDQLLPGPGADVVDGGTGVASSPTATPPCPCGSTSRSPESTRRARAIP